MIMFSSLEKAVTEGFHWIEFRPDLGVHLVERVFTREDGKLVRAMAFAQAKPPAVVQR